MKRQEKKDERGRKKPFQQEREEREKKKMMMTAWWRARGACDVGNNFVPPTLSPMQAGPSSPNFHASATIVLLPRRRRPLTKACSQSLSLSCLSPPGHSTVLLGSKIFIVFAS